MKRLIRSTYQKPYTLEEIKENYGETIYDKLKNDPIHKWRAETGIELIHREPDEEELNKIWKNWNQMSVEDKKKSDLKSLELFNITNEENYKKLIEGKINFNSPFDLFRFMNKIEYGIIGIDGKKYDGINGNNYQLYKMQSPQQFYKNKIGVCWDQTQFERYIFNNWDYKFSTYYIELDDQNQSTHTFLVYEENGKFYYFENSYEKIRGIWKSDSIDNILNFVLKNLFEDDKEYNYKIYEYSTEKWEFKTLEFMDFIINNGKKIQHKYSNKIKIEKVIQ